MKTGKPKKPKKEKNQVLVCPECGSEQVTVSHEQMFMANTGDHYCHRIKTHDSNSRSTCLDCSWEGVRENLKEG